MSKLNIVLTLSIVFLVILSVLTRIQVKELNNAINKLEPLIELECYKVIPYTQFGVTHVVCWNGHLDELTGSEKAVVRQYYRENNLGQPER